jgi:PAS domain S-box-containing protein
MAVSSSDAAEFGEPLAQASALPALLVQVLDGIPTPVYVKDAHLHWVFVNRACCDLLGRSRADLLALTPPSRGATDPFAQLHGEDAAAFQRLPQQPRPLLLATDPEHPTLYQRRLELAAADTLLICYLDPWPESEPWPTAVLPLAASSPQPRPTAEPTSIPEAAGETDQGQGDAAVDLGVGARTEAEIAMDAIPRGWHWPQFLALLANVPAVIYQLRRDVQGALAFTFVGPGAYELCGFSETVIQAQPHSFIDRIHPLDRPSFEASLAEATAAQRPWRWEGRYYQPDQALHWLQTAARPQPQPDGSVLWDGLIMDVTHRKQAEAADLGQAVMEQAIADSETRFQTITAAIPGALFQVRRHQQRWQVDYVSDRIEDIVGLTPAAITADLGTFLNRVHPGDRATLDLSIDAAMTQRAPWHYEGRLITPEGETRWWRGDALPVEDGQGRVVLCGVMLDITERKRIEEAYRESERRLRMALEVSGMSVWTWDVANDQMTWNNHAPTLFGPGAESFCQTFAAYLEQIHPDDRPRIQAAVDQALEGGGDYRVEYRVICPDGRICWVGERGGLWRDGEGLVLGLAGTLVDITDRKAAEAALQDSETRYRNLLSNVPGTVYRRQAEIKGQVLFHSDAIADLTGYPLAHPHHRALTTLIHPDDQPRWTAGIQQAIAHHRPYDLEYRLIHQDGQPRWVQDKGQPVFDAAGQLLYLDGVLLDITRRKESESRYREIARREALINRISAQIRESLQLETILQTTVQAIRRQLKTDRVVVYRFQENWHGYVVVEDVQPPWTSTLGTLGTDNCFPNGYAEYYESGRVRAIDDVNTAELDDCHRDFLTGLQVRANLIVPILIQNRLWGLLIAQECQGPRRWSGSEIELLLSLAGQVGVAISQSDLYYQATRNASQAQEQAKKLEAILLELQRTQAQLVQTEKMSSLGQLVAGVAHEINNPVSFIDGNLSYAAEYAQDLLALVSLYQTHYPEPDRAIQTLRRRIDLAFLATDFPKLLDSMRVGVDRIKSIVTSLRTFSRMDEAEIKPVDIHEGLNSTLMILQNRLKAHGDRPEIAVDLAYGNLPPVECYAGQLNQVFMNLLSNAIDAVEEQMATVADYTPAITIRTAVVATDRISITIADNGPGIPLDKQTRIFEPFYTTKPVGKGTGIGLSISYQIISDRHHGTFTCQSAPGEGTAFTLTIPQQQGTT